MEANWISVEVITPKAIGDFTVLLEGGEERPARFSPNPHLWWHDLCGYAIEGVVAWRPVEEPYA